MTDCVPPFARETFMQFSPLDRLQQAQAVRPRVLDEGGYYMPPVFFAAVRRHLLRARRSSRRTK